MFILGRITAGLTVLCTLTTAAWPTNLFVATNGSDSAAGTITAPFKTLVKAKTTVRNLLQSSGDPINVYVRQGTYYLDSTLVFSPQDGGTATRPVSYSAYQNEKVIISGGRKFTASWATYSGNIMVANIGVVQNFDMLFYNDDRLLTMARWPNYDSAQPMQGCGNYSSRIGLWKNPAGGFVRAIQANHWGGCSFKITGKNGSSLSLQWVGDNARGSAVDSNEEMVENIFEELDAPGEWFYDNTAGKLYFYPPAGVDLNSGFFVGATLEELLKIVGTSSQKVEYLSFSGFTFTHTHRTVFTGKYENVSQSDWAIVREGAIYMQDAEDITVQNCTFPYVGGNGVFMSAHNRNNIVQNCDFTNLGATGVAIIGDPSVQRKAPDFTPGPANDNYPKNITVTYCYMYDNGMFEKQTSAVCIAMSESVTVSHSTAHYGPRAGFNVCDGTFGGHLFEYNDLFDQVRESQDHGPFNSWGRDRWWSTGSLTDAQRRQYALIDILTPNTIRYNRISNPAGRSNFGIDLDDGSTNYRIYNNFLINAGVKSQHGFNHFISNNVVIGALFTFHQWNLTDMQKYVTHNIIVNGNPYYCRTKDFFPNTGEIDSNVFWNNGRAVTLVIDNGTSEISATPTWTQDKLDLHSVTADPQFVNAAECNYQVQSTSPAITLGFQNFPMNQFGKPGYPAALSCPEMPVAVTTVPPEKKNESLYIILGANSSIRFSLSKQGPVSLTVYSMTGQRLICTALQASKGSNVIRWNAFDKLPKAAYVIRLFGGTDVTSSPIIKM